MAYKKAGEAATKNGIAELAKRVPPNQALKFKDFQAKHAEYIARVNRQPEKLPNIDWEYYKRNVRTDFVKMVGEFEQKYQGVCEAFDKRHQQDKTNYFVEIDRLKKQVQDEVERYKAASNERIKALEAKYAQIQALIPYEEMTAEEYAELLPDKSFYRYQGEPSFWPHTIDEQGPGPSVKDAHGHGDDGGHGGSDNDHGGGGSGAGGSGSGEPTAKQSEAVAHAESQATPPTPSPTSASKEPAKASVVKQQQGASSDVPCFESEQFKQDLEYLKKCFEESVKNSVNHGSEKKDAAKNKEHDILDSATIAVEIAKVEAEHIERKILNVFDPSKSKSKTSYVDVVSEHVEENTKTVLLTDNSQDAAIKVEIKLDLPDLAKYLEEVASKTFDAAHTANATKAKEDNLLQTTKVTEKVVPTKPVTIFMPVEPAGVNKQGIEQSSVADSTALAPTESLAVNDLQVNVVSATEIIHDAEVPYPNVEMIRLQPKEINEKSSEIGSIESESTVGILVKIPESVATSDIKTESTVNAQTSSSNAKPAGTASVSESAQDTLKNSPFNAVSSSVKIEPTKVSETLCDPVLSSQTDKGISNEVNGSVASSVEQAKSKDDINVKVAKVQPVVVEASKAGVAIEKPSQSKVVPTKVEIVEMKSAQIEPLKASKVVKAKTISHIENAKTVPTEFKAAAVTTIQPNDDQPVTEKVLPKVGPVQDEKKSQSSNIDDTPSPENIRIVVKYTDPLAVIAETKTDASKTKKIEDLTSKGEHVITAELSSQNVKKSKSLHASDGQPSSENFKPHAVVNAKIEKPNSNVRASETTSVIILGEVSSKIVKASSSNTAVAKVSEKTDKVPREKNKKTSSVMELSQSKQNVAESAVINTVAKAKLKQTKTKVISSTEHTKTVALTKVEENVTSSSETAQDPKTKPIDSKNVISVTCSEESSKNVNDKAIPNTIVNLSNQSVELIVFKKDEVQKVESQLIVKPVESTAIGPKSTASKDEKCVVIGSIEANEHTKVDNKKQPASTDKGADDSITTTKTDSSVSKVIKPKALSFNETKLQPETPSPKTNIASTILKELSSISTNEEATKSSDNKSIITSEIPKASKVMKHEMEPVQAIIKATESASDYAPDGTIKKGSRAKIINSIELFEQVGNTKQEAQPVQAILKTTDSISSSTKSIATIDLQKNVILTNDLMEPAPAPAQPAAKASDTIKELSAQKVNSTKKIEETVMETPKEKLDAKVKTEKLILKSSKSTIRNIDDTKIKATEKLESTKAISKNNEAKQSTSKPSSLKGLREPFEQPSGTNRKPKPMQILTTSNDRINPAVEINSKVQTAHVAVKAVESTSTKTLNKPATTKDNKTKTSHPKAATDNKPSKDMQAKVSSTGVKNEAKSGFKKPNPNPSTQKGFTLVGAPETIAVKSPEAEVTRPSELFETVHVVQDQSNADKSGDDAFSKASKKEESAIDDSTQSVKAAKAES